jgi:hypothetical protein
MEAHTRLRAQTQSPIQDEWIEAYPGDSVEDFTSEYNNGTLFEVLAHYVPARAYWVHQ